MLNSSSHAPPSDVFFSTHSQQMGYMPIPLEVTSCKKMLKVDLKSSCQKLSSVCDAPPPFVFFSTQSQRVVVRVKN